MTIEHDGMPVAMFGIMIIDGTPTLWMLKTDGLKEIRRNFLRNTKIWIEKILLEYPYLVAFVDCRNKDSIRWLRVAGGEMIDIVYMGMDDRPFMKFIWEKSCKI